MRLSLNYIITVFGEIYSKDGYKTKKEILTSISSIIDKKFSSDKIDYNLYREIKNGKRQIPKRFIKNINRHSLDNLYIKSFKKFFNDEQLNNAIRFILEKAITDDQEFPKELFLLTGEPFNRIFYIEDTYDFFINLIFYCYINIKHPTGENVDVNSIIKNFNSYSIPCSNLEETLFAYKNKYKDYYQKACLEISKINTILYRNETIDFYKIYIANDLVYYPSNKDEEIIELNGHDTLPIKYFKAFGNYTSLVAGAGYGKSMFLKHLFLCETIDKVKDDEKLRLIPIFIEAKRYTPSIKLEQMVYKEINKYINVSKADILADLLKGGFLLLIDGLDELKSNFINEFYYDLNNFVQKYKVNKFVTSSRPVEKYETLKHFKPINLKGLTLKKSKALISKLPKYDDEIKNEFLTDLTNNSCFYKGDVRYSNPMLLTLMFMIYIKNKSIPDKYHEFYEEAYYLLYDEHDKIKNNSGREYKTGLGKLELLQLISEFSYILTTTQDYSFTKFDIVKTINKIKKTNIKYNFNVDDFISDMLENVNLFYYINDEYHFYHRSFQEFFTAYYLQLMDDETFIKLPEWFNKINKNKINKRFKNKRLTVLDLASAGRGELAFLKSIDFDKTNEMLIKPHIRKYITGSSEDDKLKYIEKAYTSVEGGYDTYDVIKDHLLSLIIENEISSIESSILPTNCDFDEYKKDGYWIIKVDVEDKGYYLEKYYYKDLINLSNKNKEEYNKLIEENEIDINNPEAYDYSIPVNDIIKNKDKFKKIIDVLLNDKQHFMIAFNYLYSLIY